MEDGKTRVVKYTTHLKGETIKELKRHALDNDLKDYQVMQEAVEMYLRAKKTKPHRFIPHRCVVCNGFGTLKYGTKTCQACHGRGYIVINSETGKPVEENKKNQMQFN